MQTAVGRADDLASAPTLSRLETSSTRAQAAALHGVLLDQFIASKGERPKELMLDIDATHMSLHGAQEKAHFHRYYDNYCYLPLYVFCGQDILACVLRPSSRDPASVLSALIKLITRRLRQTWPRIRIIVRGDAGFCRPQALRRFEKWRLHYVVGLQKNAALLPRVELAELALTDMYQKAGSKQRMIGEFEYAARSWDRPRRVIARLEHDARGTKATIGFAMGAAGTDTALETADVALMDDDLGKLASFLRLSAQTRSVLRQNIVLALGIKAIFLVLALNGHATLWMAVFADMGASLLVVFNGLRVMGALK